MALRELQTAAARIVFIDRATDASISTLRTDFGYHPLDLESVLSIPVESGFSSYATYAFLTLLWPDREHDETYDLRFFVDQQRLVIIGDTPQHTLRGIVDELGAPVDERHQHTPSELLHDFLRALIERNESSAFTSPTMAQRFADVSVVVRQYARWLQSTATPTVVPALIIDAHRVDLLADRCRARVPMTVPQATQPEPATPQLLGAYAVASAVMVIIVIATLSIR